MKRWLGLPVALTFLFPLIPVQAEAQVSLGPQVVLWDYNEIGVGARGDFDLAGAFGIEDGFLEALFGSVNANYVFTDRKATPIIINANAAVPFQIDGAARPYAGAGINHTRRSAEEGTLSKSGLNLLGGLFFDLGNIPAFGELQFSTTDDGLLSLTGGVLFGG